VPLPYIGGRDLTVPHDRMIGRWGLPEQYETRFRQALSALDHLTGRELEVFALLGLGMANRMIAKDLGVTERTVKAHVCRIFAKLGMDGRSEAAVVSFIWRSGMTGDGESSADADQWPTSRMLGHAASSTPR
jgi:DNA-binding CsgD family transcriptional regulator